MDMLYSCLRQAIKVKTLTNLNEQILTAQNIPVIVERFINFLFEHGLQTKGKLCFDFDFSYLIKNLMCK